MPLWRSFERSRTHLCGGLWANSSPADAVPLHTPRSTLLWGLYRGLFSLPITQQTIRWGLHSLCPRQGLVGLAPGRGEVQGGRSMHSQQEQKGLGSAGGRRISAPSFHIAGVAAPCSVVRGSGEMHAWDCASQTEETRVGQEASKSWDSDQR